jgi:HEPN domain-containing protein
LQGERFYAVSWFVQQAVEKGLKALYVEQRGVLPPRTHDLRFLATEVSLPSSYAEDITILNPAFGTTRYPDPTSGIAPVDTGTEGRASKHLAAARRIFHWLGHELGLAPPLP